MNKVSINLLNACSLLPGTVSSRRKLVTTVTSCHDVTMFIHVSKVQYMYS